MFFLTACFDDYKVAGQAENDGPMKATMRTSRLYAEPSVPLCKICTFDASRICNEPDFALVHVKLNAVSELAKRHLQAKPRATLIGSWIIKRQLVTQAEAP